MSDTVEALLNEQDDGDIDYLAFEEDEETHSKQQRARESASPGATGEARRSNGRAGSRADSPRWGRGLFGARRRTPPFPIPPSSNGVRFSVGRPQQIHIPQQGVPVIREHPAGTKLVLRTHRKGRRVSDSACAGWGVVKKGISMSALRRGWASYGTLP